MLQDVQKQPARKAVHISKLIGDDWFLGFSYATGSLSSSPETCCSPIWQTLSWTIVFTWLFATVLGWLSASVSHAEQLAIRLGEPYGTLILTLSVTSIEVMSISAVMTHGDISHARPRHDVRRGDDRPERHGRIVFAARRVAPSRAALYSQGANAYLGVIIPLAVLALILPNYTISTPGPTLSVMERKCF